MTEDINILLVDDLDENLQALEAILKFEDSQILKAKSGTEALQLLLEHSCAVALVDVQMPGMDGFELAEFMRGMERTRHVPIIFVTAGSRSAEGTFNGYESGAVDFLYKPLDPHIVRSKVRVFFELDRQKKLLQNQLQTTENTLTQLHQAQSELQKALHIRDEFLCIASHELKTPITSLSLQLQMLRRHSLKEDQRPILPGKFDKAMDVSINQVKRLTRLVEDLLDVSRIQAGRLSFRFEKVNLSALLNETLERLYGHLQAADCLLDAQVEEEIVCYCDRARIEQVIVNLITNVIKYAPGKPFQIKTRKVDQWAIISVKDQGPGIPSKKQKLIFQRFERANVSRNISGLGLGLFICKQIITGHQGEIWVESDGKSGSHFKVRLPLSQGENLSPIP